MAKIEQKTLGGKILSTFTPTEDFFSKELNSSYVKGMSYNLRAGNVKLLKLVDEWRSEGLVK